ncbi:conserved exported hypothetical protein [Cupriavidus phytorum]|uniref:Uncharacterized protein n=1 Tax=Cupriavidus taiwanensis TaxID=164546 RepID=A0A975WR79_9BURK|nr:hypothetical protein [Cupriavidus taiwanensis]SOY41178.1 conserved exported hypothetical protein [Cupriavidus taiwanensis]
MKKASIAVIVMMGMAASAQAAVRASEVYTNGGHVAEAIQRSQSGRLVDEQFRRLALRQADPFTDGARRQMDPFTDGAVRQVDPYGDGAQAKSGSADPFTDGA